MGYTDSRHVARANAARAGRMRDSKRLNSVLVRPSDAAEMVASHAEGRPLDSSTLELGSGSIPSIQSVENGQARRSLQRPTQARKPNAAVTKKRRATRKQRLEQVEIDSVRECLAEASVDRRGGWRATKAKGNRRNRRYESRLLQNLPVDELWAHGAEE